MCGITGFVLKKSLSKSIVQIIRGMLKSIHHRGPDDQGVFINDQNGIALGHARLSILDLSQNGHQPMIDEKTGVVLVYNGEVYNFPVIKKELESLGIYFKSSSDTEVILQAYITWGIQSFKKLDGMFAFAIFDPKENKLFLVRDFAGIKPLYYANLDTGLFFASEIKALLASTQIPSELSYETLSKYLSYGQTCSNNTLYQNIHKLPSGCFLELDLETKTKKITPYWSAIDYLNKTKYSEYSEQAAAKKIQTTLEDSVQSQLISDVPIGICLSGGIDSSAITAFASRHYPGKLKTFSVDFDFMADGSEIPMANFVAETFKTDHETFQISGKNIEHIVRKSISWHDEPFGDAANIPLFLISERLKQSNIKVVLQGDGGDELFAGYAHYQRAQFLSHLRILRPLVKPFFPLIPNTDFLSRAKSYFDSMTDKDPALMHAAMLTTDRKDRSSLNWLSPSLREKLKLLDPFNSYRDLYQISKEADAPQRMLYMDYMLLLQHQFLEKVDRPTMANSVEVRVPFLGKSVVELALSLPSRYKVHGKEKKYLLRESLRGIVPNKILDAPKKGFGVPFNHWLKADLLPLLKESMKHLDQLGFIDKNKVNLRIRSHVNNQENNGFMLWKLMQLGLWLNQYKIDI